MSVYLELTREFNAGRHRAVLCEGQAAVLHRLAIASKDADWILREDEEALTHVLGVLARHGATYRFGASLDVRWLAGGWSSRLEFRDSGQRVRTDFFTRPPRIASEELARMWREQEGRDPSFTDALILAEMKKTDRQKDYPFIGELARLMSSPWDQKRYSRSADDLIALAAQHPELEAALAAERPLLGRFDAGKRALAEALQMERLDLIDANERRLVRFERAAKEWMAAWPRIVEQLGSLPLLEAHARMTELALSLLPKGPDA